MCVLAMMFCDNCGGTSIFLIWQMRKPKHGELRDLPKAALSKQRLRLLMCKTMAHAPLRMGQHRCICLAQETPRSDGVGPPLAAHTWKSRRQYGLDEGGSPERTEWRFLNNSHEWTSEEERGREVAVRREDKRSSWLKHFHLSCPCHTQTYPEEGGHSQTVGKYTVAPKPSHLLVQEEWNSLTLAGSKPSIHPYLLPPWFTTIFLLIFPSVHPLIHLRFLPSLPFTPPSSIHLSGFLFFLPACTHSINPYITYPHTSSSSIVPHNSNRPFFPSIHPLTYPSV